jgi:hypothetical protein
VKVGDLVTFDEDPDWDDLARRLGIIVSFDEDDDPIIIWSDKRFNGQAEPNYRSHIVVISETTPRRE